MKTLYLILYILAAVMFLLAAFSPYATATTTADRVARVNFIAMGLLCWVLVPLIQTAKS